MSQQIDSEILELPKQPNLQYFTDANGEGWFCTSVEEENAPSGVCYHEDEVGDYDRGFGG